MLFKLNDINIVLTLPNKNIKLHHASLSFQKLHEHINHRPLFYYE